MKYRLLFDVVYLEKIVNQIEQSFVPDRIQFIAHFVVFLRANSQQTYFTQRFCLLPMKHRLTAFDIPFVIRFSLLEKHLLS